MDNSYCVLTGWHVADGPRLPGTRQDRPSGILRPVGTGWRVADGPRIARDHQGYSDLGTGWRVADGPRTARDRQD